MSNPEQLHKTGQSHPTKLKSVIHGDLWHNNIFFNKKRSTQLLMTDWQMCHIGIATNDLCFLLFSSTTPRFRAEHWDATLKLYYDSLTATLRSLDVGEDQLKISYAEFLEDVRSSTPLSLFFCGNIQDLELNPEASLARTVSDSDEGCLRPPLSPTTPSAEASVEDTYKRLQSCLGFFEDGSAAAAAALKSPENGNESTAEVQVTFSSPNENGEDDSVFLTPTEGTSEDPPPPTGMVLLSRKSLAKVPTIASENDLLDLESLRARNQMMGRGERKKLDKRKARAMRRKMYLDLYKEAANKGLF